MCEFLMFFWAWLSLFFILLDLSDGCVKLICIRILQINSIIFWSTYVLDCSRSWKLNYCMAIGYFSLTKLWLWSQLRPIRSVEYTKSESNLISIVTINVLIWGTFSRSLRSQEVKNADLESDFFRWPQIRTPFFFLTFPTCF